MSSFLYERAMNTEAVNNVKQPQRDATYIYFAHHLKNKTPQYISFPGKAGYFENLVQSLNEDAFGIGIAYDKKHAAAVRKKKISRLRVFVGRDTQLTKDDLFFNPNCIWLEQYGKADKVVDGWFHLISLMAKGRRRNLPVVGTFFASREMNSPLADILKVTEKENRHQARVEWLLNSLNDRGCFHTPKISVKPGIIPKQLENLVNGGYYHIYTTPLGDRGIATMCQLYMLVDIG